SSATSAEALMNDLDGLLSAFQRVRARTVALASKLAPDDQLSQSFPDASPTKWHLAHTSWFFERMVLAAFVPGFRADPRTDYLFNSYYESVGARQERAQRSLLTRPTLEEVHRYRRDIDAKIVELVPTVPRERRAEAAFVFE